MGRLDRDTETSIRKGFEKSLDEQPLGRFPVVMRSAWINSPLGTLLAVGNDDHLYMLSFLDLAGMERRAALIQKRLKATLDMGESETIRSVRDELARYFEGQLREFRTPLRVTGTNFQVKVYEAMRKVPFGNTITYADLAEEVGQPAAFRAVAQAVAQNPVHLLIPCHRIINSNGEIGGHAAGVKRKEWLLNFEKRLLIREA